MEEQVTEQPGSDADVRPSVLLVDDDHGLLVTLSDYLTSEGFIVRKAASAEEALTQVAVDPPDLIVLDIGMPGLGGLGFLKRIASPDGGLVYPVLVLTAKSLMEEFFRLVPVDGFLLKPSDGKTVVATIRTILRRRGQRSLRQVRGRPVRVLLGDHEADWVEEVRPVFEGAGYAVTTVANGPDVLEEVTALKPDVVVVRDSLARMTGATVASLISLMPSTRHIPVILYRKADLAETAAPHASRDLPQGVRRFVLAKGGGCLLNSVDEVVQAARTAPRA